MTPGDGRRLLELLRSMRTFGSWDDARAAAGAEE
jgi:hypothetical protein